MKDVVTKFNGKDIIKSNCSDFDYASVILSQK